MSYDNVPTIAAKLRLAIRYNDNSKRTLPECLLARAGELELDGLLDHYSAIDRMLKSSLAAHDELLDEMEAI